MKEFILYSLAYVPMPTIWLIILYFLVKSNYWKKFLLNLGFILLLIPSLPIVPTYLEKFFHNDSYRISNHHKKPSYVLVPGAGATADSHFPNIKSLQRARYAKKLSEQLSIPLIFSGGLAADLLPKYFVLEHGSFLTENASESTFDMAKNLKKLINIPDGPLLLATDPIHHKRAILTLKKQNFDILIPNNYKRNVKNNYSIIPSIDSIHHFNGIIYETLGITWYYFTGKI